VYTARYGMFTGLTLIWMVRTHLEVRTRGDNEFESRFRIHVCSVVQKQLHDLALVHPGGLADKYT